METLCVQPGGPRPDFRLLITFLWRDGQDCDTDGDARSPASREWTELTCRNRQDGDARFEVVPVREAPLTLEVRSERAELAARVAYFLALETHASWSAQVGGPPREPQELERALGDNFSLAEARRRARDSVWRRASPSNPHPNLDPST